jgi:hypothetical protein
LRSGLFQIQKREREAARKREEEQRDKLVELGTKKKWVVLMAEKQH